MANQATITTNIDDGGTVSSNVVSGATVTAAVTVGGVGATGATGPTGATGATGPQGPPGTFEDYFNVKNYGAVGDGVADDAHAIDLAIGDAAVHGGVVFFPTGTYKITHALTIQTGVSLLGTGSEAVFINQTHTTQGAIIGTDVASIRIEGMLFDGGTTTGNGIDLGWSAAGNLPFLHFTDVWVRNFGGSGLALQTPIVSIFERVVSQNNGDHGFDLYEAGTSCTFISCWARDNAKAGYHFFESVYMNLSGCAADNNGINYLVESAQSIGFYSCGSEGALTNGGSYNGIGFKIANSSIIDINSCWITDNRNIGIWITDGAQEVKINAADNTPHAGAVNFIKTDVSTNSTIYELHNTTANSLSAGTANIMNDGALGVQVKSFKVKDSSGTLALTAASDASEYNLSADTTGVLSVFGSGGQTLNVNLLDGYLQLSPLTATTVPYLDSNKRLTSSAVTPTELGYLSGVTSAIQTQFTGKQSTITFGTGVQTALGVNVGSAGAPVLFNGALGTPSSGTLTSATGLPVSTGISGLGTGIATALAINTGSAGAPVLFNGAGGTPTSLTLTNATGLPVGSLTGLGTGVATWLATPSSANLASAITDETGSGALVFGTNPTLGGATFTDATNVAFSTTTGTQIGTSTTQKLAFFGNTPIVKQGATVDLGTVLSNFGLRTGGTAYPMTTSGTVTLSGASNALGTPLTLTLTNATGLPISTGVSGLASGAATFLATPSSANLAALVTDETGTGSNVFATSPTLTTPSIDTISSASGSHLVLNAGTSKLVKLTTLRQDDTTNTYKVGTSVILTGWGVNVPNSSQMTETITFGVTFLQRPIVVATWGGDATASATYGSGANNVKGLATCKAEAITTTSFDIRIRTTDGTAWGATDDVFYQWIAIGEI